MDLHLTDRTFVVTGGSRGLGRATAEALVAEGANVVLAGRTQSTLDDAVRALGNAATGVLADLAEPESPQRLIDAARSTYGRFDGILVSVGGPAAGSLMDSSEDDWRAAFESVFLGALRAARTAAENLSDGGSIVLVLSSSVKSPIAGLAISNGLRPGLAMLVKNLADEVGPRGIRVNAVLPGRVATDRLQELDASSGDADAARARHEETIPLRRYGQPEEFGRVATMLLSPATSYVTGSMIPVDGGLIRSL